MARPLKKGLDYFPHDTNAFYDEKIQVLRMLFGNDGYATYFVLLEHIYKQNGFLKLSDELKILLAGLLKLEIDVFNSIINQCINLGLFDRVSYENDSILTSKRIQEMMNEVNKKRKFKKKNNENIELLDKTDNNEERLINAMLSIIGRLPTMYERTELEELIKEYGLEQVINSLKLAKEQNKFSIAYIKGILKSKNKMKIIENKLLGETNEVG